MANLLRILVKTEHHRVKEMISAYIDGELSSEDRARVERHLETCADCVWDLQTLRQTVDILGQLPTMPVPCSLTISEEQIPKPTGLFQWAPYTYLKGATAVVALLLALVLVGEAMLHYTSIGRMPALAPAKQRAAPTAAVMREQEVEEAREKLTPAPTIEVQRAVGLPTPTLIPTEKESPELTLAEPSVEGAPLPSLAEEKPKATVAPTSPAMIISATMTPSPWNRDLADVSVSLTTTPLPLATPTTVAEALLPTSPPPEVERGESEALRPRGLWLTPLRYVEFILLSALIILLVATLIVGRRRNAPR